MKKHLFAVLLVASVTISGCYMPINGRVVDAETQQPIEGAVVLVEWTKEHLSIVADPTTESYKVIEVMSDKEGNVRIGGCYSPFVEKPHVTVYKKGYVAWNDSAIFGGGTRTDFKWGDYTFQLERFKKEYSYLQHSTFIESAAHSSIGFEQKRLFFRTYDESEKAEVVRELNEREEQLNRERLR